MLRAPCFFFNDTATTEIYTLSLHDALPISSVSPDMPGPLSRTVIRAAGVSLLGTEITTSGFSIGAPARSAFRKRSEEHTSELQSHLNLVCRLLLEKKNNNVVRLRRD